MNTLKIKPIFFPMHLAGIIDEDFVNYKVPSMVLMFPYCTFKCNKEYGENVCQNYEITNSKKIEILPSAIYERYINNPITQALVFQGLEPMDSWGNVNNLIYYFRHYKNCLDDVVIYTGYNKDEIQNRIDYLASKYSNIIIKYGRFIPGEKPHYDPILGVNLASDNQYAEKIC